MERTSDYYEKYWGDDGFHPDGFLWPELEALYERLLPSGAIILDLGCGDGRTSGMWLTERGFNYLGVDVSSTALASAVKLGLATQQIHFDLPLPFGEGDFDAVVCTEVLEHLFAPFDTVSEVVRILRPGGIFICTTPNIAYWRSRANLLMGRFDPLGDNLSHSQPWRDPHIRFFVPRTLAAMLTAAGLTNVVVEGQRGGFLNDLPYVGKARGSRRSSAAYKHCEALFPSLFGYRLAAYGRKEAP